jgi:cell division protein FtsB
MTQPFSEAVNACLILVMLFGVILIGVGVARTRRHYRRDVAKLQSDIETLRADVEALKKG